MNKLLLILWVFFLSGALCAEESKIQLKKNSDGDWRLYINEKETPIRGAGGVIQPGMLEEFKKVGGNFTRTWGIETLGKKVSGGKMYIDKAQELGINVMPGIWLGHERHGFNYSDTKQLEKQRQAVRAAVRKWKYHPAIVMWGLGNEMEGPQSQKGNPLMWKEIEVLAKIIREEDPTRPVMTIIAGAAQGKIQSLLKYCPSIDALGVNSYGAAGGVGEALVKAGWERPFAITEFGVQGFWEAPKTSWGAPYEPHSSIKARTYYATHKMVTSMNRGKELCLGTFAFLWGNKQEKTSTWFGMYLKTGEKLPQVDAIVKAWTGKWPANRCPKIKSVKADFNGKAVLSDKKLIASVEVLDPESDSLTYYWLITEESKAHSVGGDKEYVPPSFPELTIINNDPECVIKTPSKKGAYRLFLTVRDGKGNAATANIPFLVQ